MESITSTTEKVPTLMEAITQAVKHGYTEKFKFLIGLTTASEDKYYSSYSIRVNNRIRFEGDSNEKGNGILYYIETRDRKKGFLIDNYESPDTEIAKFIRAVGDTSNERIKITY